MIVLSLFDGIATGRLALEKVGITVEKYYASEIDAQAIKVAQTNFPDIIQLGDVTNWSNWNIDWNSIDLLIGGSPCVSFSSAGKRDGFRGKSGLFNFYAEILQHLKTINPNIKFLLENVFMKAEWENIITEQLGVAPVKIDSALLSAQQRKRNYWFNWNIPYPVDKCIELQDILEDTVFNHKATILGRRINEFGHRDDYNKSVPITQCLEVRKSLTNKSNCLTTVEKDNVLSDLPPGRYIDAYGKYREHFRTYTVLEYHRLQTMPESYCSCVSDHAAKKTLGNGWTCAVIEHIFAGLKEPLDK